MARTLTTVLADLDNARTELAKYITHDPTSADSGFRSEQEQKVAALERTIRMLNEEANALKGRVGADMDM